MIPKIIWQTYKDPYDSLPEYIHKGIDTWKNLNPDYEYRYMDDIQAEKFILKEFGEEWQTIFNKMPLGVMRGDLWRYMVVYKYGGVYVDIDTTCNKPISSWVKEGYDFIVSDDGDKQSFCQFAFAASKDHPILEKVLEYIKDEFKNNKYDRVGFVHQLTGVVVWSKGIRKVLNIKKDDPHYFYKFFNSKKEAKACGFYCYGGENSNIFNGDVMTHHTASLNWKDEGYVMWQEEEKKILEKNNE